MSWTLVCSTHEDQYVGIYNVQAIPQAVLKQLCSCKARLIEAVDHFFSTHNFCSVVDRGVALKYFSSAGKLSLYSSRMKASTMDKFSNAALAPDKRLVPFDGDLVDSRARSKCFLTQAIADAQVCLTLST